MDYVIAKEFLAFALNNINLIDAAVARILLQWRKEVLIKEVVQLMSAAGLEFDSDAMSNLHNCDSILKLKESIKEIFSTIIIKLFKITPSIAFMSDLENSFEDYLKKHKEHIATQLIKLFAENNIPAHVARAKLQTGDLKIVANRLLMTFDYAVDTMAKEVLNKNSPPHSLVNFAENCSLIYLGKEVLIFCHNSVVASEEGAKLFLAIAKPMDKEAEKQPEKQLMPQLLEFKLGTLVSSLYSVVDHQVHIEGYAGGMVLQNHNAELFVWRANSKENELKDSDYLKSRAEVLVPVVFAEEKQQYTLSETAIVLDHHLKKIEEMYVHHELIKPVIEPQEKAHTVSVTVDKASNFLEEVLEDFTPPVDEEIIHDFLTQAVTKSPTQTKSISKAKITSDKEKKIAKGFKDSAQDLIREKVRAAPIRVKVQAVNDKTVRKIIKESKPIVKKVSFMDPVLEITIPKDQPGDAITLSRRPSVRGKRVQEMVEMFEKIAEEHRTQAEPINDLAELQRTRSQRSMSISDDSKKSDPNKRK
jgi:hypothetical protein